MANRFRPPILTVVVFLFLLAVGSTPASGLGGMVGGRTKIKDVKNNKELQELGKYSVAEYNRRQRGRGSDGGAGVLKFSEVVKAEKQVVSGIQYFLTIDAFVASTGARKTFAAAVVVKPWEHSKELVGFAPSPATE